MYYRQNEIESQYWTQQPTPLAADGDGQNIQSGLDRDKGGSRTSLRGRGRPHTLPADGSGTLHELVALFLEEKTKLITTHINFMA